MEARADGLARGVRENVRVLVSRAGSNDGLGCRCKPPRRTGSPGSRRSPPSSPRSLPSPATPSGVPSVEHLEVTGKKGLAACNVGPTDETTAWTAGEPSTQDPPRDVRAACPAWRGRGIPKRTGAGHPIIWPGLSRVRTRHSRCAP